MHDFLLELRCEELPPKSLAKFSQNLANNLSTELINNNLNFQSIKAFATPRRLAILIKDLAKKQQDININKKGPAINSNPKAVVGFAKLNGVSQDELSIKATNKGDYYYFETQQNGKNSAELLANICQSAIKNLQINRGMRWGDNAFSFIRPVHSVIMLFGDEVIPASILGVKTSNITLGLRFSKNNILKIDKASNYQKIMRANNIEVDFELRKNIIKNQINKIIIANNSVLIENDNLLNEVCALVEYPTAVLGEFDKLFLQLPPEALSSAMAEHQKYFSMVDKNNKLLPNFITISNAFTDDMRLVIAGNQKVIRPRLSDADFFWQQDKKQTLESRLDKLKQVLFMQQLGTMFDKSRRIEALSGIIAQTIGANVELSQRAALLSKADLTTGMVGEFTGLQGVIGSYYAKNDGEDPIIASAIYHHYHPRFAGDELPNSTEGLSVALADKLDTICGIFGINQEPTGSKDPYALRRMALGVMRIIIEKNIDFNLIKIIKNSLTLHFKQVDDKLVFRIHNFMLDRLRAYYKEQKIDISAFLAASKINNHNPYDLHLRILVLNDFIKLEVAKDLIEVNKRIANILKEAVFTPTNSYSFSKKVDNNLLKKVQKLQQFSGNYQQTINNLLSLKVVIDEFFDSVMINDNDAKIRQMRLSLIADIRVLFLKIGDITLLS